MMASMGDELLTRGQSTVLGSKHNYTCYESVICRKTASKLTGTFMMVVVERFELPQSIHQRIHLVFGSATFRFKFTGKFELFSRRRCEISGRTIWQI